MSKELCYLSAPPLNLALHPRSYTIFWYVYNFKALFKAITKTEVVF